METEPRALGDRFGAGCEAKKVAKMFMNMRNIFILPDVFVLSCCCKILV